jgi:hypothetical protein
MAASRSDQPGGSSGGGWGAPILGSGPVRTCQAAAFAFDRAEDYVLGGAPTAAAAGFCARPMGRTSRLQRSAVHIGRQCPAGNGPSPARCSRGAGQRGHGLEPPRGPAPAWCVRTGMNERGPWPPGAVGSAPEGTGGTAVSRSSAGSARMADSEQSRHQRATSCSPARHPGPARPPP